MKRREFCQLALMSPFALSSPMLLAHNEKAFKQIDWKNARLSLRAYRSVSVSGRWQLDDIEGRVPPEINGRLIRVGPGLKENHQTQLQHFFDGDAYLQCLEFKDGRVSLQAEFIETPERVQEKKAGKMLYNEFGTMAPKRTRKLRNQPNISIIPWRGNYLALSEGGHPVLLKGDDLSYIEQHDFNGTLPSNVSFTAHPKIDPTTGDGIAFGIAQGLSMAIIVYRMNVQTGELEELYNLAQTKVFMIHDFLVSENHIVFIIPPAYFKISDIIFNRGSMANALTYDSNLGTRLIVLEKVKGGIRSEHRLPSSLTFHHGNMFEEDGVLSFTTFQADNASLLGHISKWHEEPKKGLKKPNAFQWEFDLKSHQIVSKKRLASAHDFPFYNPEYLGKKNQFLYCAQMGTENDPMQFIGVSKLDINQGVIGAYHASAGETFGEPVYFDPNSKTKDSGYLFVPGYSTGRDLSFVDILEARVMERSARVWLGNYFPVGFHGHFHQAKTIPNQ